MPNCIVKHGEEFTNPTALSNRTDMPRHGVRRKNAITENGAHSMSDTGNESPSEIIDFIDWSAGDDEPGKFVTNTIVQVGDSELTLLMYEVMTPYVQSTSMHPEIWTEKWRTKLPLKATCYGRFVLTPERCEQLIDILQLQLGLYWDNQRKRHQEFERQRAARDDDSDKEIHANSQTEEDEEL